MSQSSTTLASGQVHMSDGILVQLIEPDHQPPLVTDQPPRVVVTWPNHTTVCTPAKLAEVAAAACRVLASASTELSRIKAGQNKRRPS